MIKYGYEDGARGVEAKIWIDNRVLKIKIYGSDHWWDWIINMKMWRRQGYHAGWAREAGKLFLFFVKQSIKSYDSIEIIGLSAGGAIAGVLGWIFYGPIPVHVTTVNAPKFCSRKRLKEIEKYMTALVHRGDIVTYLPPFYAAPKREYYGDKTWFWTAHNETPEEWKEF